MPPAGECPGPASPPRWRGTPLVIGLVGGIAAGKSAVANLFVARGFEHLDADAVARAVADLPAVVTAVAAAFGPGVVVAGRLDRANLGQQVFADPAARRRLEAILHPYILAALDERLAAAKAAGRPALLDAPLLFETGLDHRCDHVVFVDAPLTVRQQRAATRGWAPGELERREAAQLPLTTKRERATTALDNGQSLTATAAALDAWLTTLSA